MKSVIKSLSLCLILILAGLVARAQEAAPDTVKLTVGFSNSEFSDLFSTEYQQGLTAELDAKMFRRSGFRLGGVFQYNRAALGNPALDTYSFGPQLSVDLFNGRVTPFGRALFGLQTTYNADKVFTRTYGAGVDINLGHIVIRPAVIDFLRREGGGNAPTLTNPSTQRYGASVGVRF